MQVNHRRQSFFDLLDSNCAYFVFGGLSDRVKSIVGDHVGACLFKMEGCLAKAGGRTLGDPGFEHDFSPAAFCLDKISAFDT